MAPKRCVEIYFKDLFTKAWLASKGAIFISNHSISTIFTCFTGKSIKFSCKISFSISLAFVFKKQNIFSVSSKPGENRGEHFAELESRSVKTRDAVYTCSGEHSYKLW